ncbi:uncharacterized protein [Periplaneta americana]|uniref:uncharacterized protein n=1 Tax=Periplaneta americana TaxID=6978 RepID=UPI0037E876D3
MSEFQEQNSAHGVALKLQFIKDLCRAGYRSRRGSVLPSGSGASEVKKWLYTLMPSIFWSHLLLEEDKIFFFSSIGLSLSFTNTPTEVAPDIPEVPSQVVEEEVQDVEFLLEETSAATSSSTSTNGRASRKRKESDNGVLNEYLKKKTT